MGFACSAGLFCWLVLLYKLVGTEATVDTTNAKADKVTVNNNIIKENRSQGMW